MLLKLPKNLKITNKKIWRQELNKRVLKAISKLENQQDSPRTRRGRKSSKKDTTSEVVLLAHFTSKFAEKRFLEKFSRKRSKVKERSCSVEEGSTVINVVKP